MKDGETISHEPPKYYKVYSNKRLPKFLFISFGSELNEKFNIFDSIELSNEENNQLLYILN